MYTMTSIVFGGLPRNSNKGEPDSRLVVHLKPTSTEAAKKREGVPERVLKALQH
jgi:hypothetical protein